MDFDKLKKLLKENLGDITKGDGEGKVRKVLGKAARAGLNEVKKEIPSDTIENFVRNAYGTLSDPKIAQQLSELARNIDSDKINDVLEQFTAPFTTEEGSMQLARILKQLDQTGQLEEMVDKLDENVEKLGGIQKFAVGMLMRGLNPVLKNVSDLDEEQLAQEIRDSFSDVPTNDVADMLEALANNISPEAIGALTHQATGKLPAPKTLADIFEGVIDAGINHVEKLLSNDPNQQKGDLGSDVKDVVEKALKKDNDNKTNFGGPGANKR